MYGLSPSGCFRQLAPGRIRNCHYSRGYPSGLARGMRSGSESSFPCHERTELSSSPDQQACTCGLTVPQKYLDSLILLIRDSPSDEFVRNPMATAGDLDTPSAAQGFTLRKETLPSLRNSINSDLSFTTDLARAIPVHKTRPGDRHITAEPYFTDEIWKDSVAGEEDFASSLWTLPKALREAPQASAPIHLDSSRKVRRSGRNIKKYFQSAVDNSGFNSKSKNARHGSQG